MLTEQSRLVLNLFTLQCYLDKHFLLMLLDLTKWLLLVPGIVGFHCKIAAAVKHCFIVRH